MAPSGEAVLQEPTWIWTAVEVTPDGANGKCVFRICEKKANALDNKPRGVRETTKFAKKHIYEGNMVVSDGWAATKAVKWGEEIGCKFDFCVHSRKTKKGVNKFTPPQRFLKANASNESTDSRMVAKRGKEGTVGAKVVG